MEKRRRIVLVHRLLGAGIVLIGLFFFFDSQGTFQKCPGPGDRPYYLLNGIKPEEGVKRCEAVPRGCGPTGLIFNPRGMHAYYYKSACYSELAEKTMDETFCDRVVERWSLFDGSYYSPAACRERLAVLKTDTAAPKLDLKDKPRLEAVHVNLDGGRVSMRVDLKNVAWAGRYAVAAETCLIETTNGKDTRASYIQEIESPEVIVDNDIRRLRPWIINNALTTLHQGQDSLIFDLGPALIDRVLTELRNGAEATFGVSLQIIQTDQGGQIPDSEKYGGDYVSKHSVNVRFDPGRNKLVEQPAGKNYCQSIP